MRQKKDTPLQRACDEAGGQLALGRKIGRPQQTISNWIKRGEPPSDECPAIEKAIDGKVTRYELRPDVFGEPPKSKRRVTARQQDAAA
jgi:DNA-binding transcriptional regulator YdaS (Cro superfamily)